MDSLAGLLGMESRAKKKKSTAQQDRRQAAYPLGTYRILMSNSFGFVGLLQLGRGRRRLVFLDRWIHGGGGNGGDGGDGWVVGFLVVPWPKHRNL